MQIAAMLLEFNLTFNQCILLILIQHIYTFFVMVSMHYNLIILL